MFETPFDDDVHESRPTAWTIRRVEATLGVRLPDSYVELARTVNGGSLVPTAFPMTRPTGWAEDHIEINQIFPIGRKAEWSVAGENGTRFWQEEWGYPSWGVAIADTPSGGHELLMLDYRACGPTGEPRVVYIDQEDDYALTEVAADFASFIGGLVPAHHFDTDGQRLVEDWLDVTTGAMAPALIALLPGSGVSERRLREVARAIVTEKGYFALHADPLSMLMFDLLFVVISRHREISGVDALMADDAEVLSLRTLFVLPPPSDPPTRFATKGFVPGWITDWWADRTNSGAIVWTDQGWQMTAEATAAARTVPPR